VGCCDRFGRGQQAELATMLASSFRAEQQPVGTGSFDPSRDERVASSQKIPISGLSEFAELRMPQATFGVVHLEMLCCRIPVDHHTKTLTRHDQPHHSNREPLALPLHIGHSERAADSTFATRSSYADRLICVISDA